MRAAALLLLAALALPVVARGQACPTPGEEWTIRDWRSDYVVRPNGSVAVTERLDVDFGDSRKHGIYRDIRTRMRRVVASFRGEERLDYDIDVRSVTDGSGKAYGVKVSHPSQRTRIRIGSGDFCVTGPKTYVIHYVITRGVRAFEKWDELYWQVTGTEWPVPIERAEARVVLPPERVKAYADSAPWHADCYSGAASSTSQASCEAEVVTPGVYRFSTGRLEPGEGLTFAAAFPHGVIPGPSAAERARDALLFWGPLGLPPIVLLLMFGIWWRKGREPGMGSIVPQWEPPEDVRPGTAGTLVDQRADMDDVIATILDLAVRGYVVIREVPPKVLQGLSDDSFLGKVLAKIGVRKSDWEFVRQDKDVADLKPFENRTLDALLGTGETRKMSDLSEKFYKDLPDIRDGLYDDLVALGLFPRSPQTTRRHWVIAGVLVLVAGVPLGIWALTAGAMPLLLPAAVVSGIVVLVFAFFMPAMTPKGAAVRAKVEGLEEYVRRAEKAEIEFRNAPDKTPALFDKLLPYAVALDVSDLWVEQFAGILTKPPDWYQGRATGWNAMAFSHDLSSFRAASATTLASSPGGSGGSGSFGGGSVGGGGGGGGGGSW